MISRNVSDQSPVVRLFDLMAFFGILGLVVALVMNGAGAASIASIAALVGVCGRIWASFSRPVESAASRRNQAKVTAGRGKWAANFETESRTEKVGDVEV
nr:hypothetical protein [Streptomyces sp. DSM 41633]